MIECDEENELFKQLCLGKDILINAKLELDVSYIKMVPHENGIVCGKIVFKCYI